MLIEANSFHPQRSITIQSRNWQGITPIGRPTCSIVPFCSPITHVGSDFSKEAELRNCVSICILGHCSNGCNSCAIPEQYIRYDEILQSKEASSWGKVLRQVWPNENLQQWRAGNWNWRGGKEDPSRLGWCRVAVGRPCECKETRRMQAARTEKKYSVTGRRSGRLKVATKH